MSNQIIFEEYLSYIKDTGNVPTSNQITKAILTSDALVWESNETRYKLSLDDVVGISTAQEQEFIVNAYPLSQAGKFRKKTQRVLREYKFACENVEKRSQWIKVIQNTLRGFSLDIVTKPRLLQIIINPESGTGKARHTFAQVLPLLEKSDLNFTIKQTSSSEDIRYFIREIALDEIDSLVIVGGDGTIHDVINSLMSRADWKKAIKKPIGIIPAGTGNGLCKTLLDISGEPYNPISAAFIIAKGKTRSLDLIKIQQNNSHYYSFLSLSWGLISDVDIESEKLRYLGSLRNDLYALMRIAFLRTYKGRFSYIPHSHGQETLQRPRERNCEWQVIEDEFVFLWAMNVPWASHNIKAAPNANLSDSAIDILLIRQGVSRWELIQIFLSISQGNHLSLPYVEYYKVSCFRLEPLTSRGILAVDGEQVDYSLIQMKVMNGVTLFMCG